MINTNILMSFIIGVALTSLASEAYATEAVDLQNSAIAAIQAADESGADTTELADRLNLALEQATKSPAANSCLPSEDCAGLNDEQFQSISEDANDLRDLAVKDSYLALAMSQALAIITAFAGAFAAVFVYHRRDSIHVKRFLRLAPTTGVDK